MSSSAPRRRHPDVSQNAAAVVDPAAARRTGLSSCCARARREPPEGATLGDGCRAGTDCLDDRRCTGSSARSGSTPGCRRAVKKAHQSARRCRGIRQRDLTCGRSGMRWLARRFNCHRRRMVRQVQQRPRGSDRGHAGGVETEEVPRRDDRRLGRRFSR